MTTLIDSHDNIVARVEAAGERIQRVHKAAASVIFGQDEVIERTLVTILSGGHALLIGVPGLAKTLLVETLGRVLGLDAKRIQFTPDLMPSDIIGSEVLEDAAGRRGFRFIKGPIFGQLLMADEINRASPQDPVGAAAGDAGASRHRSWPTPRPARAVPCAGDAEPAGAGRHLPASRSPARSLPPADRRRLSRRSGRAAHVVRHHRRRRAQARGGVVGRGADVHPAPGAPDPRARQSGRGDPALGAVRRGPAATRAPRRTS